MRGISIIILLLQLSTVATRPATPAEICAAAKTKAAGHVQVAFAASQRRACRALGDPDPVRGRALAELIRVPTGMCRRITAAGTCPT